MARIKIEVPETFRFTTQIPVRITDVNYGGHVGNDSILSILHEARVQFLNQFGYSEIQIAEGIGLIMGSVVIEFKKEAFHGDILNVSVTARNFERVSFELIYRLETTRNSQTIPIAVAQTTMVCFNYAVKKVASVPEEVKVKLTG